LLLQHIENGVHRRCIGDVAMPEKETTQFGGQRLNPLLEGIALPGQRDLRTRRMGRPWRSPRAIDRLLATPRITPRLPFISSEFFTM
jgi:hypothetical protein